MNEDRQSSSNAPRPSAKKSGIAFPLTLIVLTLLIPVIPFLLFGDELEGYITEQMERPDLVDHPEYVGPVIIGLLTVDILLPIPSSVVCTVAGKVLGIWWGSLTCWLGLNLSAGVGYFLGSIWGWPTARRFSSEESLRQMHDQMQAWGIWPLAVFRTVPILAEASVLLAGVYRMPQKLFWPPVVAANFGIAATFTFLGEIAAQYGWFSVALPISIAIPISLLLMWTIVWRKTRQTD